MLITVVLGTHEVFMFISLRVLWWCEKFTSVWGRQSFINVIKISGLVCFYRTVLFHFNQFDLPFVEVHRAREFTFRTFPASVSHPELPPPRLTPGVSVWNCDGEVQWETNIRIRWVYCNNTLWYQLFLYSIMYICRCHQILKREP